MSGRLVGRERELGSLGGLLSDAAGGRGRAAIVLGEPGIGKTALVEALAGVASGRGVRTAWGRGSEVEAPPYWPWRQVLRRLGEDAGPLEDPPGAIPRAELFARVVEELATRARRGPGLVVLEDVHWADPASLALLRFVVDALPGLPLLVVATARDDPLEAGPGAQELLRSLPAGVERVALAGLGPAAVGELVADVLGSAPAADLVARIAGRCGGNPFFVREVARLHASRGPRAELMVPAGVQQVLERRLARVSQGCYELLAAAAVAGDPDPGLLAAVVGQPADDVLRGLGEAVDARLLLDDGSSLSFAHALVRDVLYGQQPAARRSLLHRRVAEALERRTVAVLAGQSDLLGRLAAHWRRAPGEDVRRIAAERALVAARDARERMGFEQAVRFYRWALEFPPAGDLGIRIELGETQVLAGELTAGRATLREAARDARREQRPADLTRAVLGMGTGVGGFEVDLGDEEQVTLLEDGLAALERSEDAGELLRAAGLARLSLVTAGFRGEEERAALAEEAIRLARASGDARTEVAALAALCDARAGPDHTEERLDRAGQMLAAAERCGDPASVLLARRLRALALAERGDFDGFDAEVGAYARTSDRLTLPLYGWLVPIWRGMRALMNGDFGAVRRYLAGAEELGARADSLNAALLVVTQRLWSLTAAGGDSWEIVQATTAMTSLVPGHPDFDAALSGFLAHAGQLDEARQHVRRSSAAGITVPFDSEYLVALWPLADAAMQLDEREAARLAYDALEPYADRWAIEGWGAACPGVVSHQLGRLATYLGWHDEAGGWLDHALAAHRERGAPLLVAQTEAALEELTAARQGAPASARPDQRVAAVPVGEGELRRSGRVWLVRWHGVEATVPDSKGMRDLAALLAAPNREVHVLDLVEGAGGPAAGAAGGSTGERLDHQARTAYRQRLADLDIELAEADAHGDAGRATALRAEQEALAAELTAALGIGGRARTEGDPSERARKAVTMRIRTALRAIGEVHPDLTRHLDRSVTTGRFCAYRPEQPVRWRL